MVTIIRTEAQEKENCLLQIEGSYVGEFVGNLSGGIKQGSAYLGMANVRITFDTEQKKLWKGGQLFANLANTHGDSPSENLIGDFQVASNIEAGNHTYAQEFWYSQQFQKVKLTIGLQDLNVELANSEHGAFYRHSSFGVHSTISDNVPAPVFPLTTPGITFDWNFLPQWCWISALYDGSPIEFEHNPHNFSWSFGKHDGFLWLNELHKVNLFSSRLRGVIKAGVYYHQHLLTSEEQLEGHPAENYGFYGVMDQMIEEKTDGTGVGLFTQLSFSPVSENIHSCYLGGGVNFYGIGKRKSDLLGIAFASAQFRGNKMPETTFELTYKAILGENIYLQPDFQYVVHPAGTDTLLKNAAITSLRFGLIF